MSRYERGVRRTPVVVSTVSTTRTFYYSPVLTDECDDEGMNESPVVTLYRVRVVGLPGTYTVYDVIISS